jgi:hypothetical protein
VGRKEAQKAQKNDGADGVWAAEHVSVSGEREYGLDANRQLKEAGPEVAAKKRKGAKESADRWLGDPGTQL